MVYPGAATGIHFEKMREGIADFEKIRIVKEKAGRSIDPGIKKMLQELQQHLQTFNGTQEFKKEQLVIDIQKGKKLLEELSERLAIQDKKTK